MRRRHDDNKVVLGDGACLEYRTILLKRSQYHMERERVRRKHPGYKDYCRTPCRENVDTIKPAISAYKARVDERRAKAAARKRERYHSLRAHGLCVRCKENAALPGETMCMDCKLYNNQMRSGAHVSSYGRYAR